VFLLYWKYSALGYRFVYSYLVFNFRALYRLRPAVATPASIFVTSVSSSFIQQHTTVAADNSYTASSLQIQLLVYGLFQVRGTI